jgi:hypothetical protein
MGDAEEGGQWPTQCILSKSKNDKIKERKKRNQGLPMF